MFSYAALSNSLLTNCDRITNFVIGTENIDGPNAVSAANLRENVGTTAGLTASAIQAVLTSTTFVKNGAATFGLQGTDRTFLALNDGTAGFSATASGITEITGNSGTGLANLAVISKRTSILMHAELGS